jgi:hypothetical protein
LKEYWKYKSIYLEAFFWSISIRFCMLFVPFKKYKHWFGKMQNTFEGEYSENQIVYAKKIKNKVLAICNNTPWESKCLVQALSCKKILEKRGIKTTLYLGVNTEDKEKGMQAHAWLKMGELVLTGGPIHNQYKVVNFFS